MGIAFDAESDSEHYGAIHSWSHTVGAVYNRLLLVAVSLIGTSQSVSSITFGSQSLTLLGSSQRAGAVRIELWYLKGPNAGTEDITVTYSATARCTFGATSWSGVDQVDTFGTEQKANSYGTDVTDDVTSAAKEVVVDAIGWSSDKTASVGADQTERVNRLGNPGAMDLGCAKSSEDGADTVTMSWTLSGNSNWANILVPLKPAAPRVARRPGLGFMFVEEPERLTGLIP